MGWVAAKQEGNSVYGWKENNNSKYHVCFADKLLGFTSTGITVEVNGQIRVYDENCNWKAK